MCVPLLVAELVTIKDPQPMVIATLTYYIFFISFPLTLCCGAISYILYLGWILSAKGVSLKRSVPTYKHLSSALQVFFWFKIFLICAFHQYRSIRAVWSLERKPFVRFLSNEFLKKSEKFCPTDENECSSWTTRNLALLRPRPPPNYHGNSLQLYFDTSSWRSTW